MIKDITIGQYHPGDSPVHQMDPRMKITLSMVFMIAIFFVNSFIGYLVVAAYTVLCACASQLPFKFLLRNLRPLMFILIFTFVLNIFLTRGGTELFSFWIITVTAEGIRQAIFLALRLAFLVMGTSILTLTTSPIALTDGLERLMSPLRVIRFPAHELAMMMTIALRFIPTLMEETDKIIKAQTARGADFETGNLIRRAKALVPLLVPLFISAFRRADELAMAMESRCYRGGDNRTRMKVLKMGRLDLYAALSMAAMTALIAVCGFTAVP